MKKRLKYVDVARGIAMICIVLGHLNVAAINRVVFTFHLPIFFFISGYFLSERGTFKEFAKKKFRAYIVPYYFTCLIMIIFALLKGAINNNPLLPEFRLWTWATLYASGTTESDPFYGTVIGAIWFLWATFWGVLILRSVSKTTPARRLIIIISIFAICQITSPIFWLPLDIQAGGTASLFMYLGWLFRKNQKQIQSITNNEVRFVGFIGVLFVWLYTVIHFKGFYLVHNDIRNGILDIVGSVCGSVLLLLVSYFITMKISKLSNFLSWIGKHSLLFLSIHVTELNMFPWNKIITKVASLIPIIPITNNNIIYFIASGKFIFIFITMWILLKVNFIRRVYKY